MRDINFLIENNAKSIWHPMAHPAEMRAQPPRIITKGEGAHVTDVHGRTVLDAVGGLWNVNLGTSTSPSIELAYELTEWFKPEDMPRVFFTSGGSDSVETALRLARQYWKIKGQSDRCKFLALKKGFHGTHSGAFDLSQSFWGERPGAPGAALCCGDGR